MNHCSPNTASALASQKVQSAISGSSPASPYLPMRAASWSSPCRSFYLRKDIHHETELQGPLTEERNSLENWEMKTLLGVSPYSDSLPLYKFPETSSQGEVEGHNFINQSTTRRIPHSGRVHLKILSEPERHPMSGVRYAEHTCWGGDASRIPTTQKSQAELKTPDWVLNRHFER